MYIRKEKAKPVVAPEASPVAIEHSEVYAAVPPPAIVEVRPMSAAEEVARFMQPHEWAASNAAK